MNKKKENKKYKVTKRERKEKKRETATLNPYLKKPLWYMKKIQKTRPNLYIITTPILFRLKAERFYLQSLFILQIYYSRRKKNLLIRNYCSRFKSRHWFEKEKESSSVEGKTSAAFQDWQNLYWGKCYYVHWH